ANRCAICGDTENSSPIRFLEKQAPVRELTITITSRERITTEHNAVKRITSEQIATNSARHDADTVKFPHRCFTQINSREHVMREFNLHPTITIMPVLFNNVPVRGLPNIQRWQVLLRRGRMRFACPTVMRV